MLIESCKLLKGTIVNRALQFLLGGSLEITLTVPLVVNAKRRILVQGCSVDCPETNLTKI